MPPKLGARDGDGLNSAPNSTEHSNFISPVYIYADSLRFKAIVAD